jgi:hypothetical protein
VFPRFDRAYWLRNCRRFRVEAPDRRLGTVADVGFGADGEPAVLIVRADLFRRRVGHVPVDQVEAIVPEEERIILCPSTEIFWQGEGRAREEPATEEALRPPRLSRPRPGRSSPRVPRASARPAPGREAARVLPGERPEELALTLEEVRTAIRAAGSDVI